METHKDPRPYLLSKALEFHFVGTKKDIDIARSSIAIGEHSQATNEVIAHFVGSRGDGFLPELCSDWDYMYICRNVIVMYPDMYQDFISCHRGKTVLFIREAAGCRPGYVHLELSNYRQTMPDPVVCAAVPVLNSTFLSSDLYREFLMKFFKDRGRGLANVSSAGPSEKIETMFDSVDYVDGFSCICWPKDADEWSCRHRVFGWPNEALVKQIISEGCHLVPVGDKCSDDTFLQWRFSFAVAEKRLIHSLNHIQFKVYGLLKYLLKQIKYRIKQDIGDDDILCSYFIKTLILYSVENSPQSLWQEKNIFVCFWFCFTTFLDWVYSGYCPNYFIPANNMFQRKVQGASKLKLLNILCDLHRMNWDILSIGNAFKPSIWEREMIHLQTPSEMECRKDRAISLSCIDITTAKSLCNPCKMFLKSKCNDHETMSYFAIVKIITRNAMEQYEESKDRHGNKIRYSSMMKCKRLLTLSFGSDLLYLATFFYKTGNCRKAIELCEKHTESVEVHSPLYTDVYCGRGTSTFNKLKQAHENHLYFDKSASDICLSELLPELRSSVLPKLCLNSTYYSLFLTFLSYFSLGDISNYRKILDVMERERPFNEDWIFHTFTGICYQKRGDYHCAIQAFQDSYRISPKYEKNPALDRIKALICSQRLSHRR